MHFHMAHIHNLSISDIVYNLHHRRKMWRKSWMIRLPRNEWNQASYRTYQAWLYIYITIRLIICVKWRSAHNNLTKLLCVHVKWCYGFYVLCSSGSQKTCPNYILPRKSSDFPHRTGETSLSFQYICGRSLLSLYFFIYDFLLKLLKRSFKVSILVGDVFHPFKPHRQ